MDKKVFEEGIAALISAFPEKQIYATLVWEYLNDLSNEQWSRAILSILTTSEEINKATNLIALIRKKGCVVDSMDGGEAWGVVMKEISRTGSCGNPRFANPLIAKAVECMGWRNLCLSENPSIDRAHFLKIFDSLKSRHERNVVTSPRMIELTECVERQLENKKNGPSH